MIYSTVYKTWNGEVLINFKWNSYGKYYYIAIWIEFFALLGCFIDKLTNLQELLLSSYEFNNLHYVIFPQLKKFKFISTISNGKYLTKFLENNENNEKNLKQLNLDIDNNSLYLVIVQIWNL